MEETVYLVFAHDESWGNHGDHYLAAFKDEETADKYIDLLEANLALLDGDYIGKHEMLIRDDLPKTKIKGFISDYLFNLYYEES